MAASTAAPAKRFPAKAILEAEDAIRASGDERKADTVYDMMTKVNRTEQDIREISGKIAGRLANITGRLDARPAAGFSTSDGVAQLAGDLDRAITDRDLAFQVLVSLLGRDGVTAALAFK